MTPGHAADSRADTLTAYLKVNPLELVILLELAGLPSKEALPL